MGNAHEVVEAKCALGEEQKDGVTKMPGQNSSGLCVQGSKVAPEPEPAADEDAVKEQVADPADPKEGKKEEHLGAETKEENGKEEVAKVDEITEKINGVGIEKEEELGKENDNAGNEEPEKTDDKLDEEKVKAEANADGNGEEKNEK